MEHSYFSYSTAIWQQLQSFEQHIILFNHLELNVMLWIQIQLSCGYRYSYPVITYAIAAINTPSLFPLFLEVKRKNNNNNNNQKKHSVWYSDFNQMSFYRFDCLILIFWCHAFWSSFAEISSSTTKRRSLFMHCIYKTHIVIKASSSLVSWLKIIT